MLTTWDTLSKAILYGFVNNRFQVSYLSIKALLVIFFSDLFSKISDNKIEFTSLSRASTILFSPRLVETSLHKVKDRLWDDKSSLELFATIQKLNFAQQ